MARCDDCKANKVCDHNRFGFETCGNYISADVAPKSEVIDEILSLIDDKIRFEVEMYNGFHSLKNSKTLCQERVNALNDIKLIINHQFRAELKKKYTEGKE